MVATMQENVAVKTKVKTEAAKAAVLVDPDLVSAGQQTRWNPTQETAGNYGYTEDQIESMIESYERIGQQEPVTLRAVEDRLEVIDGYKRWIALMMYNARHPDKPGKLKATIIKCDDKEAALRSVEANRVRDETSPIDDAYAQDILRQKHGMTNAEIARHYACDPAHVTRLQKLLTLPDKLKVFVHERMLPIITAYELAGLPGDKQNEVKKRIVTESKEALKKWKSLDRHFKDEPALKPEEKPEEAPEEDSEEKKPGKKPSKSAKAEKPSAKRIVDEEVRKDKQSKPDAHEGNGNGEAKPGKKPKSVKPRDLFLLKDFLASLTGEGTRQPMRQFAETMLSWLRGEGDEIVLERTLESLIVQETPSES